MPIYEYICSKCKKEFELRLSFNEADKVVTCPQCNASAQKQFSSFGCKTGGNIQATEKAFRKYANKELKSPIPDVMITPPPNQKFLLSPPGKKSIHTRRKKK